MSTIAAIVTGLVGQVFAISADGLRRQIFEGDRLLQGEQVITGLGGEVVLQLADGEELRLGGSSRWQAGVQEASVDERRTAAVGDLEQALAAGLDPTLELEASAAGGGAGGSGSGDGGGHSFVQLSETALRVDPLIGFVTGSMVVGDDSIIEDQGGEALSASAESPAPGSNTPPSRQRSCRRCCGRHPDQRPGHGQRRRRRQPDLRQGQRPEPWQRHGR